MDLRELRQSIAAGLHDPSHDDGSLAPLMIRYAWHSCGTYDKEKGNGGSNGGTMRFGAEREDPENAGFGKARAFVQKLREAHPDARKLSEADLQVLCGTVAIEATGGPHVTFSTGRADWSLAEATRVFGSGGCPFGDGAFSPHGSRLPAADLGPAPGCPASAPAAVREAPTIDAIRGTFGRMGFSDRETVCLIVLGHQYGRCHPDVSGYDGPWYAFGPTEWNVYEHGLGYLSAYGLTSNYQEEDAPSGKRQWNMWFSGRGRGDPFMMLAVDMALTWDDQYRAHLRYYDSHRAQFRKDAAAVWKKLTELGCDGLLSPEIPAGAMPS